MTESARFDTMALQQNCPRNWGLITIDRLKSFVHQIEIWTLLSQNPFITTKIIIYFITHVENFWKVCIAKLMPLCCLVDRITPIKIWGHTSSTQRSLVACYQSFEGIFFFHIQLNIALYKTVLFSSVSSIIVYFACT